MGSQKWLAWYVFGKGAFHQVGTDSMWPPPASVVAAGQASASGTESPRHQAEQRAKELRNASNEILAAAGVLERRRTMQVQKICTHSRPSEHILRTLLKEFSYDLFRDCLRAVSINWLRVLKLNLMLYPTPPNASIFGHIAYHAQRLGYLEFITSGLGFVVIRYICLESQHIFLTFIHESLRRLVWAKCSNIHLRQRMEKLLSLSMKILRYPLVAISLQAHLFAIVRACSVMDRPHTLTELFSDLIQLYKPLEMATLIEALYFFVSSWVREEAFAYSYVIVFPILIQLLSPKNAQHLQHSFMNVVRAQLSYPAFMIPYWENFFFMIGYAPAKSPAEQSLGSVDASDISHNEDSRIRQRQSAVENDVNRTKRHEKSWFFRLDPNIVSSMSRVCCQCLLLPLDIFLTHRAVIWYSNHGRLVRDHPLLPIPNTLSIIWADQKHLLTRTSCVLQTFIVELITNTPIDYLLRNVF